MMVIMMVTMVVWPKRNNGKETASALGLDDFAQACVLLLL